MFEKLLLTGGAILALGVCASCASTENEPETIRQKHAVQEKSLPEACSMRRP